MGLNYIEGGWGNFMKCIGATLCLNMMEFDKAGYIIVGYFTIKLFIQEI